MKNLIGMTDFVLQDKSMSGLSIANYANFLKQPLELWMFAPCDEDGNILEEPKDEALCEYCPLENWKSDSKGESCEGSRCDVATENYNKKYYQAKERCFFEGFKVTSDKFIHDTCHYFIEDKNGFKPLWNFNNKWEFYSRYKTIEDLVKYSPELTLTAQKQIGL